MVSYYDSADDVDVLFTLDRPDRLTPQHIVTTLYRIEVHTDWSYDSQSYARLERWTGDGFKNLAYRHHLKAGFGVGFNEEADPTDIQYDGMTPVEYRKAHTVENVISDLTGVAKDLNLII
jgi:hypothetical protein